MRSLLVNLIAWAACGALLLSAGTAQEPDPVHRTAYQRWHDAVDANPVLGDPFWLRTDSGPPTLRTAVADLVSFGPNLLPFLVKEFRAETNQMRLYRLIQLLRRVSGINLYFNSGQDNFYAAGPQFKAAFVSQWDSGDYANATVLLRKVWKDRDPADAVGSIDPKRLTPLLRYGVFGIPFIAERLETQNSPELFAAFLNITSEMELYADYLRDPARSFPTREQKLAHVKAWAARNLNTVDRLKDLHEQIAVVAK